MVLRALKAERSGELLADPVWDESLLAKLPRALFELILSYVLEADLDPERIEDKLKLLQNPTIRQNAMLLAEKLRQEGRQDSQERQNPHPIHV
jgi:hypothetical protein